MTIYYEEENSDEGFLAKTKVVQRWGGVWESNNRIEVNEDGGLHTQITITDLTLDDKGMISHISYRYIRIKSTVFSVAVFTSDNGRFLSMPFDDMVISINRFLFLRSYGTTKRQNVFKFNRIDHVG